MRFNGNVLGRFIRFHRVVAGFSLCLQGFTLVICVLFKGFEEAKAWLLEGNRAKELETIESTTRTSFYSYLCGRIQKLALPFCVFCIEFPGVSKLVSILGRAEDLRVPSR